ncbi:hypothetical protein CMT92_07305 [Elizabethkingia anophelis]|uniref:hypothetical protein n=1 Tax=Elizabethkingia anophelis TaxID=1117645 RepID=UPI0021A26F43|nr:hypothetical protein [Elizabethkingia anophelis]MCT3871762.1 hypothetical protein [Elizabethkingia anophelis]MDV3847458.1 hypothetical protein [Elizabethkingia anophelis]
MKAKYIIVNTQDRLPTESDQYYTDQGKIDFSNKNGNFWDENDEFELYPNWWLEEVPDHSEEMLSLLERIRINFLFSTKGGFDKPVSEELILKMCEEVDELINKVKNEV